MSRKGAAASGCVKTCVTESPKETERLAAELAVRLRPGDIIGLVGELGGGKTCFVRGLAGGLGLKGHVKSPSFNLLNIYDGGGKGAGRLPLYHIDLYRLRGDDDFFEAGLEEYIYSSGLSVIEWADRLPALLERCSVVVSFFYLSETRRKIRVEIRATGAAKRS